MTRQPVSGWRFVHPRFAGAAAARQQLSPTGTVPMVNDAAAVRQAILLLLSTSPGERVMRPDYGCRIHWLAFAPNDDTTAGLAIHYVESAVRRWEPRVDVLTVDADRDPADAGILRIHLEYRLKATQEITRLTHELDLLDGAR